MYNKVLVLPGCLIKYGKVPWQGRW